MFQLIYLIKYIEQHKMSIFVNLDSIKQTLTNRVETPRFLLDQNQTNVKEIAISLEQIARPASENCCDNQYDWVISKDVYHIEIGQQEPGFRSQIPDYIEQERPFQRKNNFKSFLHKTPIAVLFSETKSEQQEKNKIEPAKLPLYSSECKLKIEIYAIENQSDKFQLQNQRSLLKPATRIELTRDQLLQMTKQLKQLDQKQKLANSQLRMISPGQLMRRYENYEIRLKKVQQQQDILLYSRIPIQKYQNYMCHLEHHLKVGRRFHLIQFDFVLSVERFQECAGYLRAGFAKKVNFGESQLKVSNNRRSFNDRNNINNMSRLSFDEKKSRNFNFNLDFSGLRTKDHSRMSDRPEISRKNIQIKRPARSNSFMDWLGCCSSTQLQNEEQAQANNEEILDLQRDSQQDPVYKQRVEMYRGPCKTNNLFSMMDSTSRMANFSVVEKQYF